MSKNQIENSPFSLQVTSHRPPNTPEVLQACVDVQGIAETRESLGQSPEIEEEDAQPTWLHFAPVSVKHVAETEIMATMLGNR